MDADRFDALTRALNPASRRRFTRSLVGLSFGAIAPLLSLTESEAGKRGRGKKGKGKGKKKKKKDDVKIPAGTCRFSSDCNGNPDGPCCNGNLGVCRLCTVNPPCGCTAPKTCSEGSEESLCL